MKRRSKFSNGRGDIPLTTFHLTAWIQSILKLVPNLGLRVGKTPFREAEDGKHGLLNMLTRGSQ